MAIIEKIDRYTFKILEVLGIKLLVIVLSSVFLAVGKINESTWEMVVLTIAGFRTLNEAVTAVQNAKTKKIESEKNVKRTKA